MENDVTPEEYAYMLSHPGARLSNETGTCRINYAAGDNVWIMHGPTGLHTLFAGTTDRDRLNAHWRVFVAN